MTWIRTIPPEESQGLLKRIYDQAIRRTGKVFNVVRCQSLNPRVLDASMKLYLELMRSPRSPLSRARREMIAVVVSRINNCHY